MTNILKKFIFIRYITNVGVGAAGLVVVVVVVTVLLLLLLLLG